MNTRYVTKLFKLSFILCGFINITGCATSAVWKSWPYVKNEKKITAESDQIYYLHDERYKYTGPRFYIPYRVINTEGASHKFPPYHDGYILINRMDSSYSLYKVLKVLLNEPFRSKIVALKLKIREEERLNSKYYYTVRGDISVDLPFNPNDYQVLEKTPHFNYSFYTKKPVFDEEPVPDGKGFFLLGGPSGGGPSGRADLKFTKGPDFVSTNDPWEPILSEDIKLKYTLEFLVDKEIKKYSKSNTERIILTPFAVLFDTVTSPIQLLLVLSVPLWFRP